MTEDGPPIFHLGLPSPSIENLPMSRWPGIATEAERLGFAALWHSNERFYREMFIRMTVAAIATTRLGVGGAVVDPFAVHPAITAQSVGTLSELSFGRAMIALGAGGSGFPMMGVRRAHPIRAIREAHNVLTALLNGKKITFDGEFVQAKGARLHFPTAVPPPVWIASRGDRVLQLSGEIADASMIATYAQAEHVLAALQLVHEGATRAHRSARELRVMSRVDTCVHEDRQVAYETCRLMIAKLLWNSYPDRRFVVRAGLEVPAELEALLSSRDYDLLPQVAHLVPDSFVDAFCWAGTPSMIIERVVAIGSMTGIREFGFWLLNAPGQSCEAAMGMLARQVMPIIAEELGTAEC